MIHLRVVVPADRREEVLALLREHPATVNICTLAGAAEKPAGDVILTDVAREDASAVVAELKRLDIPRVGSIAMESVDSSLSRAADLAVQNAKGAVADAVVWEQVEARAGEEAELSVTFVLFSVLATLIASVGIFLDSPILIIGAMIVGPEFGPIAGVCVACVEMRRKLAARSLLALAVGFPLGIGVAFLAAVVFRVTGLTPAEFDVDEHQFAELISSPDFFAVFVALCAGVAGMLSLSTAKSGALVGVLVSVTTIPAAANVAIAAAYGNGSTLLGSLAQLAINLAAIVVAGVTTLWVQRVLYAKRIGRTGARSTPKPRTSPGSAPSPHR